jgi:hypothetical protein
MEKNGFELQPRGNYSHAEVVMRKAEIQYPIKLREHLQRTALPLTPKQQEELRKWGHCFGDRYKHTPDGKLIFTFGEDYWPTICQDTTKKTLEDKLGAFIARILRKVGEDEQRARQRAEENLARERALAEQRKREEEAARLKQEEQNRINAFKDEISRWRLSRDIHTYVQEMKDLVSSGNAKITDGGPMDRWLEWAENYAEKIDPLTPLRGELRKIGQSTVNKAETAT